MARQLKGILAAALACALLAGMHAIAQEPDSTTTPEEPASFQGMDELVNERMAEEAGVPARDPYLNIEAMGELWNLLLLLAGGVCGFLVGRHWDQLFSHRRNSPDR